MQCSPRINILKTPIIGATVSDISINTILHNVAIKYKLPIGFITENKYPGAGRQRRKRFRIKVFNGTLKQVLDRLVKQNPLYEWSLVNGVINVYPEK